MSRLPVDLIDDMSFCLIYHLFHIKCFMCGMSRSLWHLIHFDKSGADAFHPLGFWLFLVIMIVIVMDILLIIKNWKRMEKKYEGS